MNKPLSEQQVAAAGRELDAQKWHLPAKYRLDPKSEDFQERMAAVEAEQARLARAAASPFGSMSPQDLLRAQSVTVAESLRITLDTLNKHIANAIINGEGDPDQLQADKVAVRHRLAEAYATMGRFDLAAEAEPDPVYRDEYLAILDAVWRDDDEQCDCPNVRRGAGEHANIEVPASFVKLEVYSLKHAKIVSLVKCPCGFMNAIETPTAIQKLRAHRAAAQQVAGSLSPEEAARVLSARGHTSAKLLK